MDSKHVHTADETTSHLEQVHSTGTKVISDDYYKNKLFIGTTAAVAISLVCVSTLPQTISLDQN